MFEKQILNFVRSVYYKNLEILEDTNQTTNFVYFLTSNNLIVDEYTSRDVLQKYAQNLESYFTLMRQNFYADLYNKSSVFWCVFFKDTFEKYASKYANKYSLQLSSCQDFLVSSAVSKIDSILNTTHQEYH